MGLPHEVRSDGAGSFRTSFTQLLKSVGINHVHTSPYNSKSNQAERCVRSIKDVLRRDNVKKVTQKKLDEVSYLINQHVQGDSGSPASRFFGRNPRSSLPNSLERFVDHHKLITARKEKQMELASAKGRSCPSDFRPGDRILVQDMASKRWNIEATVKEGRASDDGSIRSFIVEREDGVQLLRNARFLKHEWKNPRGKKLKKQVTFDCDSTADGAPALSGLASADQEHSQ